MTSKVRSFRWAFISQKRISADQALIIAIVVTLLLVLLISIYNGIEPRVNPQAIILMCSTSEWTLVSQPQYTHSDHDPTDRGLLYDLSTLPVIVRSIKKLHLFSHTVNRQ